MNTQIIIIYLFEFIIILLHGHEQFCEGNYCYGTDVEENHCQYYSTRSAYKIKNINNNNNNNNNDTDDLNNHFIVPNCKATKIWILNRHGTRLPSKSRINELRTLLYLRDAIILNYETMANRIPTDNCSLCSSDLELITNWKWDNNITEDNGSYLATQGWNEIKYLAKFYQNIFPEVMTNKYSKNYYLFRYTKSQRLQGSFRAFVDGLFGDNYYQEFELHNPLEQNYTVIDPGKRCTDWLAHRSKIDYPDPEYLKFEQTLIFEQMVDAVSKRLGFNAPLQIPTIFLIWDMCRYEKALTPDKPSAWCVAFTPSQANILEYQEDVYLYYKNSYGSKLNEPFACNVMSDLLQHLDTTSLPNVITSFCHSPTIHLLLTAMGLYRDTNPLRSDNFKQFKNQRKWRTSVIGPFAANIVMIKYYCPDDPDEKNKILFILNQRPMQIDWCHNGLCNWTDVKKNYKKYFYAKCSSKLCGDEDL